MWSVTGLKRGTSQWDLVPDYPMVLPDVYGMSMVRTSCPVAASLTYSFLQSSWSRETGPATERPAYVWSNRYEICSRIGTAHGARWGTRHP